MKHLVLLSLLSVFVSTTLFGAIDPVYKECSQRGYDIDGAYCVFPDDSRCLLDSFNAQVCGTEWFTDDYCVGEGQNVWDGARCCEGLVAYLPDGHDGQESCVQKSKLEEQLFASSWLFWGALLAVIIATVLFYRYKRSNS